MLENRPLGPRKNVQLSEQEAWLPTFSSPAPDTCLPELLSFITRPYPAGKDITRQEERASQQAKVSLGVCGLLDVTFHRHLPVLGRLRAPGTEPSWEIWMGGCRSNGHRLNKSVLG